MASNNDITIFISHASEDKEEIANDLAAAMNERFDVWYDDYVLRVGDSLREQIDEGLKKADFGIVILSKNFFQKDWPKKELNGLFQLESANNKVILPVWHNVTRDDIASFSLMLADKVGVNTDKGLDHVVESLCLAVESANTTASFSHTESPMDKLKALDSEASHSKEVAEKIADFEGVDDVMNSIKKSIADLNDSIEKYNSQAGQLKFGKKTSTQNAQVVYYDINLPYRRLFILRLAGLHTNSATDAGLKLSIHRYLPTDLPEERAPLKLIREYDFKPTYNDDCSSVVWKGDDLELSESELADHCLKMISEEIERCQQAG